MRLTLETEIKLREQIFDARYHPNSESGLLAAVTLEGNVHIIEAGCVKTKLKKHHKGSSIRKVRFLQDGRMVTAAKTIKVHDLNTNETVETLRRTDGNKTTFYSVMPLGENLVSAGDDDGAVFVWDLRTPNETVFSSHDCEQYISDIDGKLDARKLMICTSGEGTLTAYDLRAKKMIEPQSELFEAGFQCLKLVASNKKVVIGGEDGAVYVFNQNEWAHTSGKFALNSDQQNRGKCSIDCLDVIPDSSIFLAGCSDGKMRAFRLWPHELLSETLWCKRTSLESIHVNPREGNSRILVSGDKYINIVKYEEQHSDSGSESDEEKQSTNASDNSSDASATGQNTSSEETPKKKFKNETDDYLNLFG